MKESKTISLLELFNKFPDDKSAREYIVMDRWQGNVSCVYCNSKNIVERVKRKGYRCTSCRKDFTVKTGTIFENSNIGLHKWIYAIYIIQTERKGISSLALSKMIGITQKSAWFLSHRIRTCCSPNETVKLDGIVEIDEVYIGGKERMKHKHKRTITKEGKTAKVRGKTAVFGIKHRNGETRAVVMDRVTKEKIVNYLEANVKFGTSVFSDSSILYRKITGYDWDKINHREGEYVRDEVHTNSIESVWAILKRAHKGIFHSISKKHMQKYVDEIAFRLNAGNVEIDTIDRLGSLASSASGKRLTYKELIR